MNRFDLEAARLTRLRQDIDNLLSHDGSHTRYQIYQFLAPAMRKGIDLVPVLRDALSGRTMYPDEPRRVEEPRGGSVDKLELHLEALPSRPHATLWPYRPARRRDELLSSWLWRIAQGIAAPPKRFALDAIGAKLIDVDRDIDDETLERFAFLSGRSWNDMLNATLRHDIRANAFEDYEFARKAVLRYGDLVLQRHRGRNITPILQYCPVCLAHEDTAYLRRGWRFAFEVVCWQDGCLLLDSCWRCGATVNPLGQATPSTEFRCVKCNACLAEAPSLRMDELMALQDCIYSRIQRLAFGGVADLINPAVRGYLAFLAESGLRGTNPSNPAHRVAYVINEWRRPIDDRGTRHQVTPRASGRKQGPI